MRTHWICAALLCSVGAIGVAGAAEMRTTMNLVSDAGVGKPIGTVTVSENEHGLVFNPSLTGLPPGPHGFHVHENGSCAPAQKDGKMVPAAAAGGHLAPKGAKQHGTPWGEGHLGDLPVLLVGEDGRATHPVLAPRLKLADIKGKALMIHAGGDNYSDKPEPLGGGGARIACGVFK